MPELSTHNGDFHVTGTLTAAAMVAATGSITNASVAAGAAIAGAKLVHRHHARYAISGTAASVTIPLHVARAAGAILTVRAGSIAIAVGAATVTVDVKLNGTTILTAVITLDSGNVARITETGTLATTTYVANDFFEAVVVATAGGGTSPTGLFVELVVDENPS